MSDQSTSKNVDQTVFTKEQVDAIIETVTRRVREAQATETEQKHRGVAIPADIHEELDSYSYSELQKALQRFKRAIPKYHNEEWNTPETVNPNFIHQLKQWKVDSLQLVSTIYKLTESTRTQAKAATEIYEQMQYITERGMQSEDEEVFLDTMEKARRLAVFGFGTAKQQEFEAKEASTKALRLPYSLKHLETPESSDKKYAFDQHFIEQYYEETFKQKVTSDANRNNSNRSNFNRGGRGTGSNGYRGGRPFLSQRGRGRGTWTPQRSGQSSYQQSTNPNNITNNNPNTNNQ